MRIYLPVTEKELANREIKTDLGFLDNQELRDACPVADWGAEEYEDLAMTQAAMYCLLTNEFSKYGRIVAAVEVKKIGAELSYPGAVRLLCPPPWGKIVSLHIDEEKLRKDCQKLQQVMEKSQIESLLLGENKVDIEEGILQSWDDLLAEHLCWYIPSEIANLECKNEK